MLKVFKDGKVVEVESLNMPATTEPALSATGRELIAAAERMEAQESYPNDLSDQLTAYIAAKPKLQLAWTPNELMRRASPEMVSAEQDIGSMIDGDGAQLLDALFAEANQ